MDNEKRIISHEDLMLWDSGSGFDIVLYQYKNQMDDITVKKITDSCMVSLVGKLINVPHYQLYEYTDIKLKELKEKYPYHNYKKIPTNINFV